MSWEESSLNVVSLVNLIDIFEDNYDFVRDDFKMDSVNVMKNIPLVSKNYKLNFNIYQRFGQSY